MDRRTTRVAWGTLALLLAVLVLPALAAGCGGAVTAARSARASAPAPAPASTVTTTSAPESPEAAVRRAYLQSWDDYARAVRRLDPRGLERTYANGGLTVVEHEVDTRVREQRSARVSVTHDITVVMLPDDHAAVTDRVMSSSIDVDATTGADLEGPHAVPEYYQMMLQRIDGRWKVVFIG